MFDFKTRQFDQVYRDALIVLIELSLEEMDGEEVLSALENKANDQFVDTGVVDRVDEMYFEQTDRHLEGDELKQFISLLKAVVGLKDPT
jgi:hypothetical protein